MDVFGSRRKVKQLSAISVIALIAVSVLCFGIVADIMPLSFAVALVPAAAVILVFSIERKLVAFLVLYVLNYFVSVLGHYIYDVPLGLLLDIMIVFNFFVIVCQLLTKKISVRNLSLDVLLAVGVWFVYCFLEVFNPRMRSADAWLSSIRNMAMYFFFVIVIVQISVENFHDMKMIFFTWSVLVIIAVIKSAIQKYVGFSSGDKYFLEFMDGKRTHIIGYGIRYFSIFSDAANYGGSMGMSLVVFLILGFHTDAKPLKVYWFVVALMACYGMFISGTRSALIVPVVGIMIYMALIKDFKKMIIIGSMLGIVAFFLAGTNIGQGNATIRRARTIFHKDEDKSYLIRLENRQLLRTYMSELPFGNSLGMSAGRGQRYGDYSPISEIPTDSWYVQIWVETGIIGQLIYFALMIFLFVKSAIIVFFKLNTPYVKGYAAALLSGIAGLFVMSSNCEVFSQCPNGILVYTGFALIFLSPVFDRQAIDKNGLLNNNAYEDKNAIVTE